MQRYTRIALYRWIQGRKYSTAAEQAISIAQNLAAELKVANDRIAVANDRLLALTRDYAGLQVTMGKKQVDKL